MFQSIHRLRKQIINYCLSGQVVIMKQSHPDRIRFAKSENKELFKMLNEIGIFNFYITNKGDSIQLSQIVYFCKAKGGWYQQWYKDKTMKMGQDVIHHLDHDPENNAINNLAAISHQLNIALQLAVYNIIVNEANKEKIIKKLSDGSKKVRRVIIKTIEKSCARWKREDFSQLLDWENGVEGEDWIMKADGQKVRLVSKVTNPNKAHQGLSMKDMFKNWKETGFTHKTYTP
jgi:hypothetical protein